MKRSYGHPISALSSKPKSTIKIDPAKYKEAYNSSKITEIDKQTNI